MLSHEGVEPIDPKGEAFDPLEHQAVGRVEDTTVYDETVRDVYQKGYRMADRILRAAMVTVTYGGPKRPAPEAEAAAGDGRRGARGRGARGHSGVVAGAPGRRFGAPFYGGALTTDRLGNSGAMS